MAKVATQYFFLVVSLLLLQLPSTSLGTPIDTTQVRLLSLPILSETPTERQVPLPQELGSPVDGSECGYARLTHVGIAVNKGAKATLKYKIHVKAISTHTLAYADAPFVDALIEPILKDKYLELRDSFTGGLDVPFLKFLGVDLDNPTGKGKKNDLLSDEMFRKLSTIAVGILTESLEQIIMVKGKLKATGIDCMTTHAFAFVKIARVKIRTGKFLTVLNSRNKDVIAATKHVDTLLPSKGSTMKVRKQAPATASNAGVEKLTNLKPSFDNSVASPF